MVTAEVKVIKKEEVEQFQCIGLELVKAFIVMKATENGKNTVILRFKNGPNFFEFETTAAIFSAINSIAHTGEEENGKKPLSLV